jgi:DNA polymerase (family X)
LPECTEKQLPIHYHYFDSKKSAHSVEEEKWRLESKEFAEKYPYEKYKAVPAEFREVLSFRPNALSTLVEEKDIKGVFHMHTQASDGANTLEEMVEKCIAMGWEYMGVSDHSQTAFYANGLKDKNILEQKAEIARLRKKYPNFTIFHGIESDILPDGSLDYPEEILEDFDFVIASVHGQMKMEKDAMTTRLCRAVANRHTSWLGHMTGRLLLGRAGYEFDFDKVLECAAEHGTGIELNSNPYRLDIDWRLLPKTEKAKVTIGIFPDAHSVQGLEDVHYGVTMARKGGLTRELVTNTMNAKEMSAWLKAKKHKK